MKFGSRSKSKPKASASQAAASPAVAPTNRSPTSSTSSFISVGFLMEQRERPQRVTVEELEDLDLAYEAMSLDGKGDEGLTDPSPDELFEAYTGYMEVIKASVASRGRKQRAERPPAPKSGGARPGAAIRGIKAKAPAPVTTNPYLRSMHDVIDKKRGNHSREGIGTSKGKTPNAVKATGVTRRLMEEVAVAKENMHLFHRLISVMPSSDIARRRLLKDFGTSRELLDKISRFPPISAPEGAGYQRDGKPAWDEHWVGCMV